MPCNKDRVLVDTNIWVELTLSSMNSPESKNSPEFSLIKNLISARGTCYWSPLSLSEMAHVAEKFEREYYNAANECNLSIKEFRNKHYDLCEKAKRGVDSACRQILTIGKCLEFNMSASMSDAAMHLYNISRLDGYDMFLVESMRAHSVSHILTNDSDFLSVSKIIVMTATKSIIEKARDNGKLIRFR